jgi:hypothetical protein
MVRSLSVLSVLSVSALLSLEESVVVIGRETGKRHLRFPSGVREEIMAKRRGGKLLGKWPPGNGDSALVQFAFLAFCMLCYFIQREEEKTASLDFSEALMES